MENPDYWLCEACQSKNATTFPCKVKRGSDHFQTSKGAMQGLIWNKVELPGIAFVVIGKVVTCLRPSSQLIRLMTSFS
jgi:hypothetical protein